MTTETVSETAGADSKPRHWPKHAIWIGLTIAAGNLPLYFGYVTYVSPDLRDVPWINAPLSWIGLALAATGTFYVVKEGRGLLKRGLATTGLLLTLLLVGMFNWYVFRHSYALPESAEAPATEALAPDFTLRDQNDRDVSLSDFHGKKVVLVFYRGDW